MKARLFAGLVSGVAVAPWLCFSTAFADDGAPAAPLPTRVQDVPAVVHFDDHDVYTGGVRLHYGSLPAIPSQTEEGAQVTFGDGKRHRRASAIVPDGPNGTFTTASGLALNAWFVDGVAWGDGSLIARSPAQNPRTIFKGIFVAGEPLFGDVVYANGDTFRGYLVDGCPAGPPVAPPLPPAGASPELQAQLQLPAPSQERFTQTGGIVVTGTWHHEPGLPCAHSTVSDARIAYGNSDIDFGTIDRDQRLAGFVASYFQTSAVPTRAGTLVCGTHPSDGDPSHVFGPGTYVATFALPPPAGDVRDPRALCSAVPQTGLTRMTVTVAALSKTFDGRADVRFANGDTAQAPLVDGVLQGPGTYGLVAANVTISGTFAHGRLQNPARMTVPSGKTYAVDIDAVSGRVCDDPHATVAYLFHGDDVFVKSPGARLEGCVLPTGYGTERLENGVTVTGRWSHGRPTGKVIVRVRDDFAATIVADASGTGRELHIDGPATVQFANGDVAKGRLNARAGDPSSFSSLNGLGSYTYAKTGCTQFGTFSSGKPAVGTSATLSCPNEASYRGTIAADGTVQ